MEREKGERYWVDSERVVNEEKGKEGGMLVQKNNLVVQEGETVVEVDSIKNEGWISGIVVLGSKKANFYQGTTNEICSSAHS